MLIVHWITRNYLPHDFWCQNGLTRGAHFVAGKHLTAAPSSICCSSVVSRESVWLASLLISHTSWQDSMRPRNEYFKATSREKNWFVAGPEFGSCKGRVNTKPDDFQILQIYPCLCWQHFDCLTFSTGTTFSNPRASQLKSYKHWTATTISGSWCWERILPWRSNREEIFVFSANRCLQRSPKCFSHSTGG